MEFTRRGLLGALLALPFARKLVSAAPETPPLAFHPDAFSLAMDPIWDQLLISVIRFTSRDPSWKHRIGERIAIMNFGRTYYGLVRQVETRPRRSAIHVTRHYDGNEVFMPSPTELEFEVTICECCITREWQRPLFPVYNLEPGTPFHLSS